MHMKPCVPRDLSALKVAILKRHELARAGEYRRCAGALGKGRGNRSV